MVPAALELLAFVLGLCGVAGVLVATVLPTWQVNVDVGSNIITAVAQLRGLWMHCAWDSTGMLSCALPPSALALPAHVQAARVAMVLACVLAAFGLGAAVLGMRCTRLGGDEESKGQAALGAGVCLLSAGIAGLIPTVWYTKESIDTFQDLTVPESNRREPGGAVYTAFISAVLLLISGVIFCASYLKRGPDAWFYPPKQRQVATTKPEGRAAYSLRDYV